jgi:signal transduction histidine kinase
MAGALERPDLPALPCAPTNPVQTHNNTGLPRDEPGEGIGLSIVKRLCDMLDATIELKSEPNVGTSFRILVPRHYNS